MTPLAPATRTLTVNSSHPPPSGIERSLASNDGRRGRKRPETVTVTVLSRERAHQECLTAELAGPYDLPACRLACELASTCRPDVPNQPRSHGLSTVIVTDLAWHARR